MKNSLNLVFVVLFFVVLGCSCPQFEEAMRQANTQTSSTPNTTSSPSDTNSTTTTSTNPGLTLANYNKIKEGMSYKEVVAIIGSEGVEQMSSGSGQYKVTSYKWEGEQYAFLTVIFTGDKMQSKVQYGLK